MNRSEALRVAEAAGEALLAGERVRAVGAVRSLFTLEDLRALESSGAEDERTAARLLVTHFMPSAAEEAEFLVAFALRWARSR
jgi:hypothetical protein